MRVFDLINLLGEEDPDAEVMVVSQRDQSKWVEFIYCSQRAGVSQIPSNRVLLMPNPKQGAERG